MSPCSQLACQPSCEGGDAWWPESVGWRSAEPVMHRNSRRPAHRNSPVQNCLSSTAERKSAGAAMRSGWYGRHAHLKFSAVRGTTSANSWRASTTQAGAGAERRHGGRGVRRRLRAHLHLDATRAVPSDRNVEEDDRIAASSAGNRADARHVLPRLVPFKPSTLRSSDSHYRISHK